MGINNIMKTKEKIFCIGINKTGTTSLDEAFKILGFKSVHFNCNKGNIKNIILDIRNSKNPDRLKDLNQKHNDLLNETNDLDDIVKSFQNELDL